MVCAPFPVLLTCGIKAGTVRILVPLTLEDKVLDRGLDLLVQALIA